MHETTVKKNKDYCGQSGDPFHNFKLVDTLGITDPGTAILVRMSDKMARISSLLKNKAQVQDETILDTCIDLANYAVILAIWIEQAQEEQFKTTSNKPVEPVVGNFNESFIKSSY